MSLKVVGTFSSPEVENNFPFSSGWWKESKRYILMVFENPRGPGGAWGGLGGLGFFFLGGAYSRVFVAHMLK
jgi:hypothetical protein